MVALSEVSNMFWGVTLDGGKHYTQTVERGFHISMAALENSHNKDAKDISYVSIMIQHEKAEFVLCTLQHGRLLQQPLDLNFTEGEEITFFLNGKGIVHLTGYLVEDEVPPEMDYSDAEMSEEESEELSEDYSSEEEEAPQLTRAVLVSDDDDDEDEDEDFVPQKPSGKRKKIEDAKKSAKRAKLEESSDEDEEDDEEDIDFDDMDSDQVDNFLDAEAEEGTDTDDDDYSDMDSEDEEELARLSGSFLQANKKATLPEKSQGNVDKKGKETPKAKATPGKETPSGKKHSGKETPGDKRKKGSETPGEKKKHVTPEKQKSGNQATPSSTSELDTSQASTEKKKRKRKNKKNKQKLENGGGDASSNQQSKPGTPATGQKAQSKPGTPATGQKSESKPGKHEKRVLEGGVLYEDKKDGHGPQATPGKTVQVYYTGRLESGKIFDMSTTGKPFKFKLGKNEVIRGWDVGVKGMKVGGKRKLTIPAKMAYGNAKNGDIPAGSTLIFDVELKNVS